MTEPRLEDISDYNTLKGEKKKIVWIVIITGMVIGALYGLAYHKFDDGKDSIKVEKSIHTVPVE
jgi:flagellar basal body-associated protein FliL